VLFGWIQKNKLQEMGPVIEVVWRDAGLN